ncbi:aminodeoxychorismate lyase [Acidimicrobium ferrooxidans DSM 10331]|uniref:Endolytic murein transglycosylase n=1 Tax=Acidimicrobium ferrooxidans (strain DSM 10331 / JCM 15462 / NBRC 103882 / ICP) TaxID=525909 RepID=C7LYT4_ACIFD|nr:aminodeoxychorismate lyase [Acidimicrobium ferrooxidans DSM 10331]
MRGWPKRLVALALVVVLALGAIGVAYLAEAAPSSSGHEVAVLIEPGTSLEGVSSLLAREGVVRNGTLFDLYLRLRGSPTVDAGVYFLRTGEGYAGALSALTAGPATVRLVVVPGMTIAQIAARLAALPEAGHNGGAFVAAASAVHSYHNPFLRGARSLEGFLYPDTYFVDPAQTPHELIQEMVDRFTQEALGVGLEPGGTYHGLSAYQVVIAASIVTKEATAASDAPKVARVILNRLAADMPLDMDSTVRFATGNENAPLTAAELASPSPWNTYTHRGLPPTPIGQPSVAAIDAVLHPATGPWLYFVALRGHRTESFFTTYAAQQAAIARYGEAG